MKTLATLALLAILTACGGGDPEDTADTQPVDCAAKVEACR